MTDYYLAIDLGASGGRHILGSASEDGKINLEEVYRFPNGPADKDGVLVWDIEKIFDHIVSGIAKCAALGKIPKTIAIDTWGVDYVLVDSKGEEIKPAYCYRDGRTAPFIDTSVPFSDLYKVTGIALMTFNTVYQLLADKAAGRLKDAEKFLMLGEYFSCRLAGSLMLKKESEYTIASTTGLLDAVKRDWAYPLIKDLGLPEKLFLPVREPPFVLGPLSPGIQKKVGFDAQVVMIASHDTASAVAMVEKNSLYISSGTWSLLGIQTPPILNDAAREAGYGNEGALDGNIRFLKNIMGLWMIQQLRHELNDAYSFAELETLARETAKKSPAINYLIDVNLPVFLNPPSMIEAVKDECRRQKKNIPETPGQFAFCLYSSLAECYRTAVADLEKITGRSYKSISIIGGGSRDTYLNDLTAAATGKTVIAGPAEATAMGNILLQLRLAGKGN